MIDVTSLPDCKSRYKKVVIN